MSYNSRVWLNGLDSSSTGSIVTYTGQSDWSERDISYIEIADCHGKVRLHKTDTDTMDEFVHKLRTIADEASKFADHLESLKETV